MIRRWRRWRSDVTSDAGSASILVLAVGLSLTILAVAMIAVGNAMVARHRAQAAADFGALAGALSATGGADVACARADELVAANGARMVSCEVRGLDVTVRAEVDAVGGLGTSRAAARAGPER